MLPDLFSFERRRVELGPGAAILGGFACDQAEALLEQIAYLSSIAPFRHMQTPGGRRMSVAMLNAGALGWVSDASGYRYTTTDPQTGRTWPTIPPIFIELASRAAQALGFGQFVPDACLINRYAPGTRLSLHQDRDEQDHQAPIVSVSLGLPATFLWGGLQRQNRTTRYRLAHGDVAVWGGPSRLMFHGISELKDGVHPLTGALRYNLTFRKVR
mgnify:FL=1